MRIKMLSTVKFHPSEGENVGWLMMKGRVYEINDVTGTSLISNGYAERYWFSFCREGVQDTTAHIASQEIEIIRRGKEQANGRSAI